MAAGLLSGGIHEFQELNMIPVGIEQFGVPKDYWIKHPLWEAY